MTELAKSILKTMAFFDAQDMPLTLMEIRNYLVGQKGPAVLIELENVLETELATKVSSAKGLYYLKGHDILVNHRHRNYRISLSRIRKAKKVLRFLRFIPYVRAVALSGSQALLAASPDSDIDLLIVTAKNRIWITRLLVSLYLQILGQRRYGSRIKNRFCLNHYISEDLQISRDRNMYTAVEYASLLPVFGAPYFKNFWRQNSWIKGFLPNAFFEDKPLLASKGASQAQKILEFFLEASLLARILNHLAKLLQQGRIRTGEFVLASDSELSFHPESKGQQILAKFDLTKDNFEL